MIRADVLKWRKQSECNTTLSHREVCQIIDCYESLLSRCKPWLEWSRIQTDEPSERAELDALLRELTEVKHEK